MQLISIRGNELAVSIEGAGPTFIWGHNLLGCMEAEDDAGIFDWAALSANNTLVRYDARGHGDSQGSQETTHYQWSNLADDMLSLADTFAAKEKVVLGGSSMGCATALQTACEHPDRVAGLVLVLPPTGWKTRPAQAKLYRRMARFSGTISRLSHFLFDTLSIRRAAKNPKEALSSAVAQHLGHANRYYIKAALLGAADSDMPSMAAIERLDIPTLILGWEDDDAHPVSTATMLNDLMAGVHSCHITTASGASEWSRHIQKFLQDIHQR